jgi:large subunit ribosomal protein L24
MAHQLKNGDEVVVITGSHKGKRGAVLRVLRDTQRIVVQGVAMIKRHTKPRSTTEKGSIVEREGSLHLSNVMLAQRYDERRKKKASSF